MSLRGILRGGPPLLRVGVAILGGLLLLVAVGPLGTGDPDAIVDPAASALLAPGSQRTAVRLADGSVLMAQAAIPTGEGWALRRLGEERLLDRDQVLDVRSRRFWLGTDSLGRDVTSRLLHGGRVSLALGLGALAIATACGLLLGVVAGWAGGAVDGVLMRLVDAVLAVPMLLLVLLLAAVLRPSLLTLTVILGLSSWMGVARLVRTQVMTLKRRDFVLALGALGASRSRILLRHVLPNALTLLGQDAALRLGDLILLEASLSFLGFGVQPPTASWGGIMADLQGTLASGWWLLAFPALLVASAVLGSALLAEGLQERLRHLR